MEQIANAFKRLKEDGKAAFVPFSVAGFPSRERSLEVFLKLAEFGDVLEFGFPFSDPIADGPVIQLAAGEAIRNGLTMDVAFEMISEIRDHSDTPIVFFSYFNPIHKYGAERFAERAHESGVNGVLVVDLPLEESSWLKPATDAAGLAWINLATPTTPGPRIERMNSDGSGFLYYVSRTGVTGADGGLPPDLALKCERLRQVSRFPVAVGFGISTPADARALKEHVDGIVVGSAILSLIQKGCSSDELDQWLDNMAEAVH
ncbi:MAG: tryptophan synthase subunit alpha [Desulfomonile tiedjei]|uniref:Tryptophan synthase alpha chain n=1 Tax=Desulfomonile tiedjei TaxID=2358 RepID=A0A9D6V6Q3_9BACT|nr:tryptophan synthase subunit alpha [Desulfomonile tiedjei]